MLLWPTADRKPSHSLPSANWAIIFHLVTQHATETVRDVTLSATFTAVWLHCISCELILNVYVPVCLCFCFFVWVCLHRSKWAERSGRRERWAGQHCPKEEGQQDHRPQQETNVLRGETSCPRLRHRSYHSYRRREAAISSLSLIVDLLIFLHWNHKNNDKQLPCGNWWFSMET